MNQKMFSHKWFIKGNISSLYKIEKTKYWSFRQRKGFDYYNERRNEIQKKELENLQNQQNSILKQIGIHSIIQTYICKNIKKICDEEKKLNLEREQERRPVIYFTSMFEIFKGFKQHITQYVNQKILENSKLLYFLQLYFHICD